MPEKLERELRKQASKKKLKGKHKDAYIYGTMRKTGWKPSHQVKESVRYHPVDFS